MKKTKSLLLILVMVMLFSTLSVSCASAVRTEEAKVEELFNKSVSVFEPFKSIDENQIKAVVNKDTISKMVYDLFVLGIKKNDELNTKLGDGKLLKESIDKFVTDENIALLLTELKTNKPIKSTPIIGEFIKNIEKLFKKDWDSIVSDDFRKSTKLLISMLSASIDTTERIKITDIDTNWAKDEIQAMINLGVINGYLDKTFRPNNRITRAEFAKIIVNTLKLDKVIYTGGFNDIAVGQWYADNVATMVKNELTLGYPDGTFKPNGEISRDEMAVILSRALKLELSIEEQEKLLSSLKDIELVPNWAKASVARILKTKLVNIGGDNNYNPLNKATRAEAASAIFRLIEAIEQSCNV